MKEKMEHQSQVWEFISYQLISLPHFGQAVFRH